MGRLEAACTAAAGGWAFLAWQRRGWEVSAELDPLEALDAWELDRVVRGLEGLRKQPRRFEGELLGALAEFEGWWLLGFASFRHYCREWLGLRESEPRRFVWFAAGLAAYPELGEKMAAGARALGKERAREGKLAVAPTSAREEPPPAAALTSSASILRPPGCLSPTGRSPACASAVRRRRRRSSAPVCARARTRRGRGSRSGGVSRS